MGSATISTLEDGSANVADPGDVLGNDQSLISTMLENLESSNITQDESHFRVNIVYTGIELGSNVSTSPDGAKGQVFDMDGGGGSGSSAAANAEDHVWDWHIPSALFSAWSLAAARVVIDNDSTAAISGTNKYTVYIQRGTGNRASPGPTWSTIGTAVLDSISDEPEISLSNNVDLATSTYGFIRVVFDRDGNLDAGLHVSLKFAMRHAS